MAKYKDYPVYTYDEPATYSDFSGGINTDPSNEHLQPNEIPKELKEAIEKYIYYYNNNRYQEKLGCLSPMEYHDKMAA